MHYDCELSEWLDKKGIYTETYDIYGGVESIVNPWASANRIIKSIKNAN